MSLPDELSDLTEARAYPHLCEAISVVETHISWVILTGELVYKLKKPVRFSFLDFSTLELREHFCREELRCNRRFAPSLYLEVVAVVRDDDGRLLVVDTAHVAPETVTEWAVKMRQFPPENQLDRLLEQNGVTVDMLYRFGRTLASQHRQLPVERGDADALEARVLAPARDNYDDVEALDWVREQGPLLARSRSAMEAQVERHRALMLRRLETDGLRECHGDLHLSNLVLLEDGVTAFDCLEFNPDLRWIDPESDVAFLFMDCLVRGRGDLGYAFLDGYLNESGDYEGATLLPFYAAYRSMVRAKVAALSRGQASDAEAAAFEQRFRAHAVWAADWLDRPPGKLVLMCGLSGSGKSYLAERLTTRLPALRLRSDVARKVRAGLEPGERVSEPVGGGLYGAGTTRAVYGWLAELAEDLLRSGEHVVVDATFIRAEQREPFLALAHRLGREAVIVHCDVPRAVLEARIVERARAGGDPSDADLDVLEHQTQSFQLPQSQTVRVNTAAPLSDDDLATLSRRLTDARHDS